MATVNQVNDYVWELPVMGGMRVPGRIYADRRLMEALREDQSLSSCQRGPPTGDSLLFHGYA